MKKRFVTMLISAVMAVTMCVPAFAGQWLSNSNGWYWMNDDGTYPVNEWQWIDGDGDGISECYYFDGNGYCLINTTTPDGYEVDNNGAWIIGGNIQRQAAPQPPAPVGNNEQQQTSSGAPAVLLMDLKPTAKSNYVDTFKNVTISYDDTIWKDYIRLSTSGYVEFATDGLYNELTFTLGFQKSGLKSATNRVRVYGDHDNVLLDYSTEVGYNVSNKPKDFTVNISGQQSVTIQYTGDVNVNAIFKDAMFK